MTNFEKFEWEDLGRGTIRSLDVRIRNRKELAVAEAEMILSADSELRYQFCMETIARHQEIWTVWDNDQILVYGGSPSWIPIFPSRQISSLASRCEKGVTFVPIPVDDFVNEIVEFLSTNSIELAIFPSFSQENVILVDWKNFLVDLTGAWELVYGIEARSSPAFEKFAYKVVRERNL